MTTMHTTLNKAITKKVKRNESKVELLLDAAKEAQAAQGPQSSLGTEAAQVPTLALLPVLKGTPIEPMDTPMDDSVSFSDHTEEGPMLPLVPMSPVAGTKFADMRSWINGPEQAKVADHETLRYSYHAGITEGKVGVSAEATLFPVSTIDPAVVRSTVSRDRKTVDVNVRWRAESESVVLETEDRDGPYLAFDTVLAAVAAMIGVSVAQLLSAMRVTGIREDRRAGNFLVKQGAVGKGLLNNPEKRKTVTFQIEPPIRCDLCHAVTDTYWQRKAPGSSIGVVVCKSKGPLCPKTAVVIQGKTYNLEKNANKHAVFFV
jgi:hypothetical protein